MKPSIIIPTFNEAQSIAELIRMLRIEDPEIEIIVVDGGSVDGTCATARTAGAKVFTSSPGRGRQLATGADVATGDVLVFLHADTRPGSGWRAALQLALRDDGISGGNFRVIFNGDDRFSRWLTRFYAWFRRFGLYYGDSCMFVRRTVYEQLGGIRPIALMEDYDFNRRLQRFGGTICIAEPAVETSSRRFRGRHPIAIVLGWLAVHALFFARVSPDRLARYYDTARMRPGQPHR